VATLFASLGLERAHATCWQGSISAYYYTPVHSVFVAALGVIGVALIAIRGNSLAEEIFLNMAGFLAPVVAFVPTAWSPTDCPSNLTGTSKRAVDQLLNGNHFFAKFSGNNLVAFLIGGIFAVVLASIVAKAAGKKDRLVPLDELVLPALASAGLVVAGIIWHSTWPASFNTHAHSYAAILMFLFVGIVVTLTALRASNLYKATYFTCAGAMLAGGLVFLLGSFATWQHKVLVVEGIEILAFSVFWFFQTIQLWDEGLPLAG
ncbi:MAG TPA: hypothetical protein VLX59_15575, partial [Acidimicrobiales bacterium]|nr:hypothetical protein [Acidimicrobiales bacterium]